MRPAEMLRSPADRATRLPRLVLSSAQVAGMVRQPAATRQVVMLPWLAVGWVIQQTIVTMLSEEVLATQLRVLYLRSQVGLPTLLPVQEHSSVAVIPMQRRTMTQSLPAVL